MSIEHAQLALQAAELAYKATAFVPCGELLMIANSLWRRGMVGRTLTPELAKQIDLFTARSLELRASLDMARKVFGQRMES